MQHICVAWFLGLLQLLCHSSRTILNGQETASLVRWWRSACSLFYQYFCPIRGQMGPTRITIGHETKTQHSSFMCMEWPSVEAFRYYEDRCELFCLETLDRRGNGLVGSMSFCSLPWAWRFPCVLCSFVVSLDLG